MTSDKETESNERTGQGLADKIGEMTKEEFAQLQSEFSNWDLNLDGTNMVGFDLAGFNFRE